MKILFFSFLFFLLLIYRTIFLNDNEKSFYLKTSTFAYMQKELSVVILMMMSISCLRVELIFFLLCRKNLIWNLKFFELSSNSSTSIECFFNSKNCRRQTYKWKKTAIFTSSCCFYFVVDSTTHNRKNERKNKKREKIVDFFRYNIKV
jgi:hypothetical protein